MREVDNHPTSCVPAGELAILSFKADPPHVQPCAGYSTAVEFYSLEMVGVIEAVS